MLEKENVPHDDQRIRTVQEAIRTTILEIFGPNSPEYRVHEHHNIWHGPLFFGMDDQYMQQGVMEGCKQTVKMLEGLIGVIEEKRAEQQQDSTSRVRSAFMGLDLHSRIASACVDTYKDGHYREAVLNASIALVNYVKEKSGQQSLDGANLMRTVFSIKKPILAFNPLADQTDFDEQEGLMHLFEGAVMALRNPRAHDLAADSAEFALEYIAFLSLLAKRLDSSVRQKCP